MVMYEINFISPILFKKIKKMISIKYFLIKKKNKNIYSIHKTRITKILQTN